MMEGSAMVEVSPVNTNLFNSNSKICLIINVITEVLVVGRDLAQDAAHDLPGAGLWQGGGVLQEQMH